LQPDTVIPDLSNPQSWNRYSYVTNNPTRYNDPSGHGPCDETDDKGKCTDVATILKKDIESKYKNVKINGKWSEDQLLDLSTGLDKIMGKNGFNGNKDAFNTVFGSVTFSLSNLGGDAGHSDWDRKTGAGIIKLDPSKSDWRTVVHEMGHLLSWTLKREFKDDGRLSYAETYKNVFNAVSGTTDYGKKNSGEDFADSFMEVIQWGSSTNSPISKDRRTVITALIQSYTSPDYGPGR
jgi:hypothetical protein